MPGNRKGGLKAAQKNRERYGDDFYRMIGSKGGQAETTKLKGFAANRSLASLAGAKGGRKSRRTGVTTGQGKSKEREYVWKGGPDDELTFA